MLLWSDWLLRWMKRCDWFAGVSGAMIRFWGMRSAAIGRWVSWSAVTGWGAQRAAVIGGAVWLRRHLNSVSQHAERRHRAEARFALQMRLLTDLLIYTNNWSLYNYTADVRWFILTHILCKINISYQQIDVLFQKAEASLRSLPSVFNHFM